MPRLAKRALWLLALWTVPAIIAAGQLWVRSPVVAESRSFWQLLAGQAPAWYLWAALTPVVLWLGRQVPFRPDRVPRWLALHGAAAVGVAVVHEVALLLFLLPAEGMAITAGNMMLGLRANLPLGFLQEVAVYGVVLGAGALVDRAGIAPEGSREAPGSVAAAEPATPEQERPEVAPVRRIPVKSDGRTLLIDVDDIDWIEAADYYARLHVGSDSHLVRESLRELERLLDSDEFVRVHRSAIVRIDRVASLEPYGRGDALAILGDGTRLRVSRTRSRQLRRALGLPGAAV